MQGRSVRRVAAALAASLTVALAGAGPLGASAPRPRLASLPDATAAHRAAAWLAGKVDSKGVIVMKGTPDLSDTAAAVLALEAADTTADRAVARRALTYLAAHVNAYVRSDGADEPGELATLILGAHALGLHPTSFGGTNLVSRLLATLQRTGPRTGLFGAQDPTYDGAYRQGLALAALAAAGITGSSRLGIAIHWLTSQQCSDGGWEAFRSSTATPCTPTDPSTYSGPDTNSTAVAVEGLVAQHVTPPTSPLGFLAGLQAGDGGWGYYGGSADPDSTALVIQALVALRVAVTSARFVKGSHDAASALLSFQLSGGAFLYPGAGSTPNLLSTEQATPALAKKAIPF